LLFFFDFFILKIEPKFGDVAKKLGKPEGCGYGYPDFA
jgi:hypothetical protein